MRKHMIGIPIALLFSAALASAQTRFDPAAEMEAQKAAMTSLAVMDGVWRGPAWTIVENGTKHEVTQTERIGPFLGGAVKVLEGRGYDAATGEVTFNAFGTISFDRASNAYTLHSYAMGRAGNFKLTPTADGYIWEIPVGPMTIKYTAVIKNGAWREIGERIMPGQSPVQFFEMNLTKIGTTDWPAAGAIPRQ